MSFGFGFGFPRRMGVAFSPASLFAAGEQGAWYDPSDLTTLYQDSAGTTPVTAVEQPVGLMLDKSRGLVLGPELVVNGDFSNAANWTGSGDSFSISDGIATLARTTTFTYYQSVAFNVTAGKSYWVTGSWLRSSGTGQATVQVRDIAGGNARFQQDASPGGTFQPFRYLWTATATESVYVRVGVVNAAATVQFDLVSIRELPGNHASQSTTASRPVLSARVNLLTQTETFSTWTPVGATVTTGSTYLNGTASARITTTGTLGRIQLANGVLAAATYRFVLDAKAGTASSVQLAFEGGSGGANVTFNLSTLAFTPSSYGSGTTVSGTPTITLLSAGWYRLVVDFSVGVSAAYTTYVFCPSGAAGLYVDIINADLRVANESSALPAYQRVGAATYGTSTTAGNPDYDTTGFPLYLRFDGSDDSLSTSSINFTSTDKMSVFAGVRKLSDATGYGVIAENTTSNGSFSLTAPSDSGTATYYCTVAGTTRTSFRLSTFTAPHSAVISVGMNIAGATRADELFPRVNGAIPTLTGADSADAGTGTFGNYPLFIGRRNNASLPFNGRLYSLIVRGALTSGSTLEATENYVETKTFGKDMTYVYYDEVTIGASAEPVTIGPDGEAVYVYKQYQ